MGSNNSGRARHFDVFFSRFLTLGAFSSLTEHLVDMWPPHHPGEAGSRAPCRAPWCAVASVLVRRVVRRACAVVRRGSGGWVGGIGFTKCNKVATKSQKGWPGCDPVEFLWDGTASMPKGRFVS